MPDTYTHYTFGQKVLSNLDKPYQEIVLENIDIFNVGLQGPDILFYYKPLVMNWVNQVGYRMHNKSAAPFFTRAKSVIKISEDKDLAKAYIAGFICHFYLDSECHPYIHYLTDNFETLSHSEIETEFDRRLLIEDGHDPINYRVAEHLTIDYKSGSQIAKFFPERRITSKKIIKSVNDMKRYSILLEEMSQIKIVKDSHSKRRKGLLKFVKGMIMRPKPIRKYQDSTTILKDLYVRAILPAAELIDEYFDNIDKRVVNDRFDTDFN
ncbi:MAG: zinc dependent phospholipase C family protein [Clostridia bacterium]